MEQTIKINVPEGKVAKYNEETQTIEFVDKEPVRSKSWEEFCKNHPNPIGEWYVSTYGDVNTATIYDEYCTHLMGNVYLSTEEDALGILALIQLTRLHDEWVGDWKPTEDRSYRIGYHKYLIVEYGNHRLLSFPTYDIAVEFLNCFKDLLERAKRFI